MPLIVKEGKSFCIIDPVDVVHEASSWEGFILCAVLGSKPALKVFEGYARCIWNSFGIKLDLHLENNHFMVKFNDIDARDAVVNHGIWFFNRKPLIVRSWTGDVDMLSCITMVPIWVKFPNLHVRY